VQGQSWQIRYGDRSTANGKVYKDAVSIGSLTVPDQAVEAAATISVAFSKDPYNDGLLGLAFVSLEVCESAFG
jgi:aspergillopepsin I